MTRSAMPMGFLLVAAFVCAVVTDACALINPKFTPAHLVNQSVVIAQLKPLPESDGGKLVLSVEGVLKGSLNSKTIEVDLTATAYPDQARFASNVAKESADKLAMLFIGEDTDEGKKAYIHIEGKWFVLADNNDAWKFEQVSTLMLSTWNGGTDMLLNWVKCVIEDPAAEVPVRTGVTWARSVPPGKVAGKIAAAVPVDLKGTGVPLLFVASDAGDKLFSCVDGKAEDLTAQYKLQSKSMAFAWSDLNGDGKLDLASWDGKVLTLYTLGADGTFTGAAGAKALAECIGLTALDVGVAGKPGLLVSTSSSPLLLIPGVDATARTIVEGEWTGKKLGRATACLLADFDGDGLPDVVQPLATGGLFYKGTGPGSFAPPVACSVAAGEKGGRPCLGDWNQDGLLDILIPGNDKCRLWENRGNGAFMDMVMLTGEISTNPKGSSVAACCGDLNNDGRQDLVMLYPDAAPQVFFSRGYRCFGLSTSMDLLKGSLLPSNANGQVAGCVADFTGDGAQDLVVVLNDGQCLLVVRAGTGEDRYARAMISPKSGSVGPVRVWAMIDNRVMGAWNIAAGSAPAFMCRPDAGPLKIKWRFPGQPEQSRDVVLEGKPVDVLLEPSGMKK